MKSTISDNRQLFNVKAIAAAGLTPNNIPEGTFGVVDEDTNLTVLPVTYAALPKNFRFISKLDGKVYYSFDTIGKTKIYNEKAKVYQAEVVNSWKATLASCDCTKGITLNIGIDEQSLIMRDGLTWKHKDFIVAVSPEELACYDCAGKGAYENNVMTKLLFEKVLAINSPFYTAQVQTEEGVVLADSAAIQAFIDTNYVVNTGEDSLNNGEKLVLFIKGKPQPAKAFRDLEINYVYPRGVRLSPFATINGVKTIAFEEVVPLTFELGAGPDMRAEESDAMSLYTGLNHYKTLSDGIASADLIYQFENSKNYDTFTFEFDSKKSGLGDVPEGKDKAFNVILGSETGNGVHAQLVAMLTVV